MNTTELIALSWTAGKGITLVISPWIVAMVLVLIAWRLLAPSLSRRRFALVKLDIALGGMSGITLFDGDWITHSEGRAQPLGR